MKLIKRSGSANRTSHAAIAVLKWIGGFFTFALLVAMAENNWLGFAWRSVELTFQRDLHSSEVGPTPATVMGKSTVDPGESTTILAVGDIVSCSRPEGIQGDFTTLLSWVGLNQPLDKSKVAAVETVELINNWPNAPVLALGDIVYSSGTPYEFANCFDPIWGVLNDRTLPTPGNHEYYTPAAYAYFDYWGAQAGPERRGYYAIRYKNWLMLSLNSEVPANENSPQGSWLAQTLASSAEDCIIAFFHRPAYSLQERKNIGSERELFAKLESAGADIVLNGHNHFYERTYPLNADGRIDPENGILSFIVGTGGRGGPAQMDLSSITARAIFGEQGVLRVDLNESSFEWAFHVIGGGVVLDEGRRDCK